MASIECAPFGWGKAYRYEITREIKTNGQGDLFIGDGYVYRAIMPKATLPPPIDPDKPG